MITVSISAASIAESGRLDANYFTAAGVRAANRLNMLAASGVEVFRIGDCAEVEHVTRFKRVIAARGEPRIPFLRAFDVFEYLPEPADELSALRTPGMNRLRVEPDVILVTRSGRNLGPSVLTDEYLAEFIPSDDLIRIRIDDEPKRLFTFAFLSTPSGQELLRQDRTGSVISHLSARQVGDQIIPVLRDVFDEVVELTAEAHRLRGAARKSLSLAVAKVNAEVSIPVGPSLAEGWSVRASALGSRLDAAFHQPWLRDLRAGSSGGVQIRLGDVAEVSKPGGRYKTKYVSREHGHPLLSGRQLLQFQPIGQKFLAESALPDPAPYVLQCGMVAFQADGRAEESLGQPVLITEERDGWFASGHVGRVRPHDVKDSGWIWASMASRLVRDQLASLARGSVVDALYEEDISSVMLPPRSVVDSSEVRRAWSDFDDANRFMRKAINVIETRLWN